MKVLIVSDTHRISDNLMKVLEIEKPIDMLIHCGDVEGDENLIEQAAGCPCLMVTVNNDFFSDLPKEREFFIGKNKVWLTHGHYYYVSMNNEIIKGEARVRGADIVMYGHIHRPLVEYDRGLIAVNPGSLTYPRQEGRLPSYVVMDVDDKSDAKFEIKYLKNA